MNKYAARLFLALWLVMSLLLVAWQSEPTTAQATLVSAAPNPAPAQAGQAQGQSLSKNVRLDPAIADDSDSQAVNSYIYEGLVRLANNTPEPALAAAWTVSENGLSYIFHLRPSAVFHDGTPVTADAIMANFNRWFDPQSSLRGTAGTYSAWSRLFLGFKGEMDADGRPKSSFDGIEKVDELTVLLHLNRQDPLLLSNLGLSDFGIVNPNTLAAQSDKYGTTAEGTSGTGPYLVSEWTADSLVIKPNPKYWGPVPELGDQILIALTRNSTRSSKRGYESLTSHKEMNKMRLTRNLGMLLLAIWLILTGLTALLGFNFQGLPVIMAILAIGAGILILIGR